MDVVSFWAERKTSMIQKQDKVEVSKSLVPESQHWQMAVFRGNRNYLKLSRQVPGVLIAIALATTIRIALIGLGWQTTNSDEGTMGLMALHIAYHGELPIFFYGQNYMGVLEAYIGAVLFHIFGPSLFSLRLGLVFLFDLFLLAMYLLIRLLYTEKLALATIFLLCFGSIETFTRQLKAVGGALETLLFGSLTLLLASWLVISYNHNDLPVNRKRRVFAYGGLGCVMGLGLWSHMLVLPFVVMALLLLILFNHRELLTPAVLLLSLGFIIGILPLILYKLEYPTEDFIQEFLKLHSMGGTTTVLSYTFGDQLLGTILVSIPMATGASPVCAVSAVPGQWRQQMSCMLFQGCWGVGFLLLFIIAIVLAVRELRGWYKAFNSTYSPGERLSIVRCTARLAVLGSAGLTLLAYVSSPAPALVPVTSARYLVGLLIAFPAIFWPIWSSIRAVRPLPVSFATIGNILQRSLLLFVGLTFLFGTVSVFARAHSDQVVTQGQYKLIDSLLHLHVTRIYSDYWTCDRIIFQSDERIICSVVNENLQPGQNRYPPYRLIVQNDAQAAYLLPLGSPQGLTFTQKMLHSGTHYASLMLDNYILYRPLVTSNDAS
jgi:hypothetical protein